MHLSLIRFICCLIIAKASFLFGNYNAYVANAVMGDLSQIIIDPITGAPTLGVVTTNQMNSAQSLAISPNQENIYVGTSTGEIEQFSINPFTGVPIFVTAVSVVNADFISIKVAPNGKNAYAFDFTTNRVYQISLDPSGTPSIGAFSTGGGPSGAFGHLAISPNGQFIYVAYEDPNGTVTSLSIDSSGVPMFTGNAIVTASAGASSATDIAIAPNGMNAYVTNSSIFGTGTVTQIQISPNSGSMSVITNLVVNLSSAPGGIAIAPDGRNAYTVDPGFNQLTQIILDPITGNPTVGAFLTFSEGPTDIVIAPNGQNAYPLLPANFLVRQVVLNPDGTPSNPHKFTSSGSTNSVQIAITNFFPPVGKQKKNKFLTETELYNRLEWQAYAPAIFYNIYRDAALTEFVESVPAEQPIVKFIDHTRKKGRTYTYYIVAYNASFMPTFLGSITVPPREKS